MNISGIIVEYNPFHNGHIYHLNKVRELTNPDLIIAVTSGNYSQRGDISIYDKFSKTELALKHGVDLVVELPYIYTTQSAYVFGEKSVNILNKLKVNNLVFGSETNNLEELQKFAEHNIDVTRLKELLNEGFSYPKAYGLLAGSLYPNDILAITYLKALRSTDIKPYSVQRTNAYHSDNIEEIASASAIRKGIENNLDVSKALPNTIDKPIFNADIYPYLRNLLFTKTKKELSDIFLVNEGIENMLIKNAYLYDDYESFINNSISRRYTRARIQRTILQICLNIKKGDINNLDDNYIRVLGFNQKGQQYLNSLKKEEDINIITQFKKIPESMKTIEWKASSIYASLREDPSEYLKKELKGPIIY